MNQLSSPSTDLSAPSQSIQPMQVAQPMQTPPAAENPLDQLRDIHLPDQIDQFPYAPGWWILLAVVLIGLGYWLYRIMKHKHAIRLLKPAKIEIAELRALENNQIGAHAIAKLSALLKRICLVYFPTYKVASLSGINWLTFLNQQCDDKKSANQFFSKQEISMLSQASYQLNPQIKPEHWSHLLSASERCIEKIIRNGAKR